MSASRADTSGATSSADDIDDLMRVLAVGARGEKGMKEGDAFHLRVENVGNGLWRVRACVVDAGSAPLPHGAAYVDVQSDDGRPRGRYIVARLLENARAAARRNLAALAEVLGIEGGAA